MFRFITLLLVAISCGYGQSAWGLTSLEFLILSPDAVTAARGETGIAWEQRLEGLLLNPATLPLIVDEQVTISWARRIAGINQFNVATTLSSRVGFPLAVGINSVNYGHLDGRDIWGNSTGEFPAQDIMLYATTATTWRRLQLGVTTRLIYSVIDNFSCSGLAVDLGIRHSLDKSGWDVGLVLQNAGIILSEYSSTSSTDLPLRLRAGLAKRLLHLPLRWFLDYTLLGETSEELQLGGEFYLPIGWTLRGGYLFSQGSDRLESLDEALRGVTFGFGGEISKRWLLDYSYTSLGVLGSVNRITLALRF